MKLILNGGGIGEKCHTSYKKFADELNGGKVLFIPFANNEQTPSEALEWIKSELKVVGIDKVEMIENVSDLTMNKLKEFSGVYFSGGNAFLLLSVLQQSNKLEVVRNLLKTNKVVMGGSAGAVIFGKSIAPIERDKYKIAATDKNIVKIEDKRGLNVINDYSLFVHYKLIDSQVTETELKMQELVNDGYSIIALPEETSLFITEKGISVIGDASAEIITANAKFDAKPGEFIFGGANYEKI